MSVTVTSSISKWKARWTADLRQLRLFLAAQMQTNRGMLFIHSGSYNGHETWKPPRLRDGQPLRDRGTLMKSIAGVVRARTGKKTPQFNEGTIVRITGESVTVGTSLKKAEILSKGGTILPKKGKFLWIPLSTNKKKAAESVTAGIKAHRKDGRAVLGGAPIVRLKNGKFFMLAKKVVIPPRPFDKLNDQDRNEIAKAMSKEVTRCLNKDK